MKQGRLLGSYQRRRQANAYILPHDCGPDNTAVDPHSVCLRERSRPLVVLWNCGEVRSRQVWFPDPWTVGAGGPAPHIGHPTSQKRGS